MLDTPHPSSFNFRQVSVHCNLTHATMFLKNPPSSLVLIFITLFQSCTANSTFGKDVKNGSTTKGFGHGMLGLLDFHSFKSSCKGGDLMAHDKVCIPKTSKGVIQDPPAALSKHRVCLIKIEISNVQIIRIDLHAITISMYLDVDWNDDRLSIINGSQSIYLSYADQKMLWAPEIVIGTNMVSRTMEQENFILKKDPFKDGALACKRFILSTTVKCEMDFQKFPFDKHICNLEVGLKNSELS